MAYADIATIQTIATGQPFLAATLEQIRLNEEFLIDPPACSVYNSVNQNITTGSTDVLTADSETFDNDSMHSTATNTSRITIQTAGRYLIGGTVKFATSSSNTRSLVFYKNGSSFAGSLRIRAAPTGPTYITGYRTFVLEAGDYMELAAYQDSGVTLGATLFEFAAFFMSR